MRQEIDPPMFATFTTSSLLFTISCMPIHIKHNITLFNPKHHKRIRKGLKEQEKKTRM